MQAGVIETGVRAICTEGIPYDRCLIGIVTNLDTAQLIPELHIADTEALSKVMRTQVDVVLAEGASILNADDSNVAALAELSDGDVVFFSQTGAGTALRAHLAAGKRAVVAREGKVMLAHGDALTELTSLAAIPVTDAGRDTQQTDNMLAAIAAAWALGLDPALIRTGVETFGQDQADISVAPDSTAPALEVSV